MASALIPAELNWASLHDASARCRACDLYKNATQTVFGEGPVPAPLMMVGEQPGNDEDRAGHPFIGPAGKLLRDAMQQAGLDPAQVYVTNVVKHFKWEPRGKRRIHAKPNTVEIAACMPWLQAEIELVKPDVLVCLGATAAQALLGRAFRVSQSRGKLVESPLARYVTATVHPSSILRAPDSEARHLEMQRFVEDLHGIAKLVKRARGRKSRSAAGAPTHLD